MTRLDEDDEAWVQLPVPPPNRAPAPASSAPPEAPAVPAPPTTPAARAPPVAPAAPTAAIFSSTISTTKEDPGDGRAKTAILLVLCLAVAVGVSIGNTGGPVDVSMNQALHGSVHGSLAALHAKLDQMLPSPACGEKDPFSEATRRCMPRPWSDFVSCADEAAHDNACEENEWVKTHCVQTCLAWQSRKLNEKACGEGCSQEKDGQLEEVRELEKELKEMERRHEEIERELKEKEGQLEELMAASELKDGQAEEEDELDDQKDAEIVRLRDELAERDTTIAEELGQKEVELARLRDELAERDTKIAEELGQKDAELARLRDALAERDAQPAALPIQEEEQCQSSHAHAQEPGEDEGDDNEEEEEEEEEEGFKKQRGKQQHQEEEEKEELEQEQKTKQKQRKKQQKKQKQKKRGRNRRQEEPTPPPLAGTVVSIAGKLGLPHKKQLQKRIRALGGASRGDINAQVTHLVASAEEVSRGGAKVRSARALGVPVVSAEWVEACERAGSRVDEEAYLLVPGSRNGWSPRQWAQQERKASQANKQQQAKAERAAKKEARRLAKEQKQKEARQARRERDEYKRAKKEEAKRRKKEKKQKQKRRRGEQNGRRFSGDSRDEQNDRSTLAYAAFQLLGDGTTLSDRLGKKSLYQQVFRHFPPRQTRYEQVMSAADPQQHFNRLQEEAARLEAVLHAAIRGEFDFGAPGHEAGCRAGPELCVFDG